MEIERIKICDFTNVITGGTPSTSKDEYWKNGDIPWLNSGELNNSTIFFSKNHITELGLNNSSAKMMPPETVLIALTGTTTGVTSILKIEACANQSVTGILPSESHISEYLYYFLLSSRKKILKDAYGGAQKHISQAYVKDLEIPLPPISQQKAIAEKLDKADALRKKDQELLTQYDELAQALFIEMFGDPVKNEKGWEVKKVDDFNLPIKSLGRVMQPEFIEYVDISSIDNVRKKIISTITFKIDERPSRAQQILDADDILLSTVRPNLKNIAINNTSGLIGSTGFFVFRCDKKLINHFFLFEFLNSDSVTNKFSTMVSGANYPALKSSDVKNFEVIIPPILLQTQFAEKIKNIEVQKALVKQQAQQSEDLFQALLQESFSF